MPIFDHFCCCCCYRALYIRSQFKVVGHCYLVSLKVDYKKEKVDKGKIEIMKREREKLATIGINNRPGQSQML